MGYTVPLTLHTDSVNQLKFESLYLPHKQYLRYHPAASLCHVS